MYNEEVVINCFIYIVFNLNKINFSFNIVYNIYMYVCLCFNIMYQNVVGILYFEGKIMYRNVNYFVMVGVFFNYV